MSSAREKEQAESSSKVKMTNPLIVNMRSR
jgi:hypothetical protein